jgi:prepilin signal peptidase PulO-like enzyme (type II secretory pathway)
MLGLYLGPAFTAGMYVCAIFLAAIVGLTLIVIGGRSWGSKIPFGPYLAGGAIISVIWGAPILQWYINLAFRR